MILTHQETRLSKLRILLLLLSRNMSPLERRPSDLSKFIMPRMESFLRVVKHFTYFARSREEIHREGHCKITVLQNFEVQV
jgi:hypothetical protein